MGGNHVWFALAILEGLECAKVRVMSKNPHREDRLRVDDRNRRSDPAVGLVGELRNEFGTN